MEKVSVDIAIVGAGIVGLSLAYELKKKFKDAEIVVFEKEIYVGEHSSGRNSGVLHAGIYYPHQSLKHLLCIEGNKLWDQFSSEIGIQMKRCGKYIFSTSQEENTALNELLEKAKKNSVIIREASLVELSKLREDVNASHALFSPNTGIVDVSETVNKLKYKLESLGVYLMLGNEVKDIESLSEGFNLRFDDFQVSTSKLINCAGLGAVRLRSYLELNDLESFYVRGHYLSTSQKLSYNTLFYPVPPKDLKGLGVHSTIDIEGKVKFGPNTEEVLKVDYSPPKDELGEMKDLVSFYFKNIEQDKLYWDYAGCRSKIRYKESGSLHTDFWIQSPVSNYIECLGIESPGVTSAPAIAGHIINNFF